MNTPAGRLLMHSHWLDHPATCIVRAAKRSLIPSLSNIPSAERRAIREVTKEGKR